MLRHASCPAGADMTVVTKLLHRQGARLRRLTNTALIDEFCAALDHYYASGEAAETTHRLDIAHNEISWRTQAGLLVDDDWKITNQN